MRTPNTFPPEIMTSRTRTLAAVLGGILSALVFWAFVSVLFSLDAPDAPDAPDAIDAQGVRHFTVTGNRS